MLARAARPHRTVTPAPGRFEHDAETVWWADFTGIVRELLDTDGVDPGAVAAVGVSGIGGCLRRDPPHQPRPGRVDALTNL